MAKRTTMLLLVLGVLIGDVWAGQGAVKRLRDREAQKTQMIKDIFPPSVQQQTVLAKHYSGATHYSSAAGVTTQIDDASNNRAIWGIYGPGRNIVRDAESGRITAGWSRTPTSGKPRTVYAANSTDAGASWNLNGPLDDQSAATSRGYYTAIFRADNLAASPDPLTEYIVYSERDQQRLDIIFDFVPGLLIFDVPRGIVNPNTLPTPDPTLDMVFTFAASAPNGQGGWNIYISEYQTLGQDSTQQENIIFVKSTDSGATWSTPSYIYGNNAGQIPQEWSVNLGNYCALAMAIDPNDVNHIGGLLITNYIPNYNAASIDTLLRPGGFGTVDYHYYYTESTDAGDSWSEPEMLLGRNPMDRRRFEFSVEFDTSGNGQPDLVNPAYLYGGAQFWAFLYEPVFTSDGTFHAAIMPAAIDVPEEGSGVDIIGNTRSVAVYARRSTEGQWDYVWDLAGTVFAFDSTGDELGAGIGQAWFAEMAVSADDNIAMYWSSRLPAYNLGTHDFPNKGHLMVAGSPDNGTSWTDAVPYALAALPEANAGAGDGAWAGSSIGPLLIQDSSDPNVYYVDCVFQGLGLDNVTNWGNPTSNTLGGGIGIWYSNDLRVDMSTATVRIGPSAVGSNPTGAPATYSLGQNYPNPFNPSTTIEYSLSASSHVKLSIHNAAGQVIAVLVDGTIAAGAHTVNWNASQVPSGVYLYKLEAENFSQTRKLILMK